MGLYANGYRLGNTPFKRGLGALVSIYNGGGTNFNHRQPTSSLRTSSGLFGEYNALPNGNLHPNCWMLPQKAGAMSSHDNARVELAAVATLFGGKALEGSTSLTISTNTPDGELIAFGLGSVTISLSTNSPLLTASIDGGGSASFTIETNLPVLGAEASIVGETTITISIADADMQPIDDASPLRTATASMSFAGTLTPYAIGRMEGTTEELGLTVAGITNSVWNALLANYSSPGTAGNALGLASSGGVDYDALAEAVWSKTLP